MSSKHDLYTAIITVAVLAAFVVLDVTHNVNAQVISVFTAALGAGGAYWFVRGGNALSQQSAANQPTDNIQQAVTNGVTQALTNVAKQGAATNAPTNSGNVQG